MLKFNKSIIIRVTLLASLFISTLIRVSGQTYYDVFGQNEYTMPFLEYDSINDEISTLIINSPLGVNPLFNTSQTMHRLRFDANLSLIGTNLITTSAPSGYTYHELWPIEGWKNYVLARRFDLTKPNAHGEFPFLSNYDFCELRNDSLVNCTPLFNDSAYAVEIYGWYAYADSLILLSGHYDGVNDSVEDRTLVSLNKSKRVVHSQASSMSKNGIDYLSYSSPILLSTGDWLVRVNGAMDTINLGLHYSIVSSDWSTVKSIGVAGSSRFSSAWNVGGNVVYVTAEMKDWANWNPSDPFQPQVTLVEYDYKRDTILSRHYFDFSNDTSNTSSHTFGYAAMFDGEHFVICGRRSTEYFKQEPALFIGIIDTNFNLINRVIIEDTVSKAYPLILGNINGLVGGKNSGEYFYGGSMDDSDVNIGGYTADIMLGKISTSNIGLKEPIPLRKQELWMYPNPSNGVFTLTSTTVPFKPYSFQVFDSSGKVCAEGKIDSEKERVELNLSAGSYYLLSDSGEVLAFVVER